MHRNFTRLVLALGFGGLLLALGNARVFGDTPLPGIPIAPSSPVTPTVPAPVPPHGKHVRFENLVRGQPGGGGPEKGGNGQKNGEKVADPVETGPALTLGECISIALERQPSLKAVKASMAATEAGFRSLTNFGTVGTLLSPDLEIRKQQAQRGLAAACAEFQKAHNEVVQDVTRLYYTAVYAKQQQVIADDLVGQLTELVEIVREILKTAKNPGDLGGLSNSKLLAMEIGLNTAKELQADARIGRKRAMAALRQLMAVDYVSFPFRVKDSELPVMEQKVLVGKDLIVELALTRRPELALAAAGVDAFRLEVYAQGKIPFKRVVPTLASASDIHAKDIPPAMRGTDYRPGGVAPEMPTQLVGSKFDRVSRAIAYSERAEAVYESARTLVTLEAENAYLEFELASEKLQLAKQKRDSGVELQKSARENAPNTKAKDLLLQAEVAAARAQSDYVQAVYQYILSLAALERITAGGIRPAFPDR